MSSPRSATCLLLGLCLTSASAQEISGPPTLENLLGPEQGHTRPLVPPQAPAARPTQPVPDEAAVEEARGLIRLAFEDDYKAAATNPQFLLQKLLTAAGQTPKPERQYALYLEAEQIAADNGDIDQTMLLVDTRAKHFAFESLDARLERLKAFLTPDAKQDPKLLATLFNQAMQSAAQAVEQDALPQAKAAAELAAAAAKSLSVAGNLLKNEAIAESGRVCQLQAEDVIAAIDGRIARHEAYRTARAVLEAEPDDPAANGIVGSYLCFERGDWAGGLAALAKGDRGEATAAAKKDLEVFARTAPDALEIFAVAGTWWTAAEADQAADLDAVAMKRRSAELYAAVRDRLVDPLDRQIAAKRAAAPAAKVNPAPPVVPPLPARDLPPDAFKIGDHWYCIIREAMTQADAAAACKARGGYLAKLTEKKELTTLARKLEALEADQSYWIDGTDAGHEGKWTFLDGTPLPETQAWYPGEPNNGNRDGRGEHGLQVMVLKHRGRWMAGFNDGPQRTRAAFICEWD